MSYAVATVLGNLGGDPDLRNTPSGSQYCNFNVASSKNKKGRDGQWAPHTTWWRCVVWGRDATTIAEKFVKGDSIMVTGEASTSEFTGQDGVTRTSLELDVKGWSFGGGNKRPEGGSNNRQTTAEEPFPRDEDIPF